MQAQNQLNQNNESQLSMPKELNATVSSILNRENALETEQNIRRACSSYKIQNFTSDNSLEQTYQENINAYHHNTPLYLIKSKDNRTNLIIYDTELEREEIKELDVPESLNWGTCIAILPNNELFCYEKYNQDSGITLIIDKNLRIRKLPSGIPCFWSSAIYFKRNVYCFGRLCNWTSSSLSMRFDIDKNQWIKISPMSHAGQRCHSAIFNGNILVSGKYNIYLLLYSIDIDSWSIIPYEFSSGPMKYIISIERLYLIEYNRCYSERSMYRMVYESEIGNEYAWKQVAKIELYFSPMQIFCSYNKETIYISSDIYKGRLDYNTKTA